MRKISRWKARDTVLTILFVTWIVSFMDRMIMSVAIPYIAVDYHLSPLEMGAVMSAFFASYSVAQIPGGLLADAYGVRKVATIAMLWWSGFTAITGAAANLTQMLIARVVFGLGEGVYPACAFKTVAVWFPKKERATATAIKLAAGPLGAAISPLVVGWVMNIWGWRSVFYSLFIPGVLIALLFWIFVTDTPSESRCISTEELREIEESISTRGSSAEGRPNLLGLIRDRSVLKYFCVLFAFDIAYWGFTTWLPTYLVKARHLSMGHMEVVASLPFFAGAIGCALGGWVSDKFFSVNRRVPVIATQLLSAVLLYLTFEASSMVMFVSCQTLAGFFLMSFFSAFWALPMNTVPKEHMGIVSGFINMAGQIAAFVAPISVGYLVGAARGDFGVTFTFLVVSLLASCAIVFTLPSKWEYAQNGAIHG